MSGKMHVMVDLETMGSSPGSAIASIGAVAFDPDAGTLGETFYQRVDLESCVAAGLRIEADTVLWWMRQSTAARAAITEARGVPILAALQGFSAFCANVRPAAIWGHGANFDDPVLAAAYRALGLTPPWKFWTSRCTRTLYGLAGVSPDRDAGTHHNALDDAIAQARAAVKAWEVLRLGAAPSPEPLTDDQGLMGRAVAKDLGDAAQVLQAVERFLVGFEDDEPSVVPGLLAQIRSLLPEPSAEQVNQAEAA